MNNTLESYLEDRKTKSKWLKIKKYSFLKESTYDVTSKCNIRCDGCYYFAGEKSLTKDQIDPEKWRSLFKKEKERGITFVVLAGAEPAIVPMICKSAYNVIPVGAIATNGIIKITDEVKYRIHISVWGDDEYSYKYRGVKNCLKKQIKAYANDDRAIFIYTITKHNIEQLESVTKEIVDSGFTISFNQFSSPVGYTGELTLDSDARHRMRDKISQLMETYREKIIYSGYNVEVHSHDKSLNDLFSCPYPRVNKKNRIIGLGKTFRQYRSDLSIDDSAACCVPDTDCNDCRHYASGSAIVSSKLLDHVDYQDAFLKWLDYVDTYLAVWVYGYKKDRDLYEVN